MSARRLVALLRAVALLLAVALAAPTLAAQRPLLHVELASGERIEASLESLDADGFLLDTPTGRRRVARDRVRLVTRALPRPEPPPAPDVVILAGEAPGRPRGRLHGRFVGGDDRGVRVELTDQRLDVPFEVIDRLLPRATRPLDRLLALEGGGFDDRVWRLAPDGRLDSLTGVLAEVDAEGLLLESGLGELRFAWAEALAVVLAATAPADDALLEAAPERGRLALADGSLLDVGLLDGDRQQLRVVTAFAGELRFRWELVDELVLPDPALGLAVDADPLRVVESSPALPEEPVLFPWQRDLSVTGRPLSLAGVRRAAGLGVHADARLVFAVPPGARAFRVAVGVADEVAELPAEASMTFHLELDGERVAGSGTLGLSDGQRVLRVDALGDAAELALVATAADDLDAGDRGVFATPLFLGGD